MKIFEAFQIQQVVPLNERDYLPFMHWAIQVALRRIWVCQFHISLYSYDDVELEVRGLIKQLASAAERHIDVRVLIDQAQGNAQLHKINQQACLMLDVLGVNGRTYSGHKASIHAKYMLVDDELAIIGSHNFSHRALCQHREASLAITSPDLTTRLSRHFGYEWYQAGAALQAAAKNGASNEKAMV